MKWTTTKLITAGSLGVLLVLVCIPGNLLVGITGITGIGGVISGFLVPIFLVFTAFLLRQFGTVTLMCFIYAIAALPTPQLGPPGFLPKVIILVILGLIADSVYFVLREKKNKKVVALLIGGVCTVIDGLLITGTFWVFKLPGIETFIKIFLNPLVMAGMVVYGALGGLVGYFIYAKFQNTSVVKRIQR